MIRTISIVTSLAALEIILSLTSPTCLADIQGDVELLKTIALKHKANLESILTLKGEAFEERTSTIGDWFDLMVKNKCTFAYDQLRDAVRWNKEPQEGRCIKYGQLLPSIPGTRKNYNSTMFKDGTYFNYFGSELPNDKSKVAYDLVIGEPAMAKGDELHCLDPRYFLSHPAGPTVHARLMLFYDHANDETEVGRSVKQKGNLVTFQYSAPDKIRTSKEVYDLSAGGNMVEYYSKTPTVEITRNYAYEEKSGVWVLKSYAETIINHRKNGEISKNTRMINWTNSVVNVPFKEDEFTVENLGVKPGARVSDHKLKMVYRYGGFERDLQSLEGVDTGEMAVATISLQSNRVPAPNDVDATAGEQADNGPEEVVQGHMLSETTPRADGIRRYIYPIVAAIVMGLGAIVYMLTRRFGKE